VTAIGIFDSGVGGLTVLKALRQALPNEAFAYLGDTARLPYGAKSPRTIRRYLAQNAAFLENIGVKAIVVACNSASTALTGDHWGALPIYGVIEPGARAAASLTRNGRVGVLGTRATIESGAYVAALARVDPTIAPIQRACPLLVPLVEEGLEDDEITDLALRRYLEPVLAQGVDTLILGCTHYPALKSAIRRAAGDDIALVDSAEAIAARLLEDLASARLSANRGTPAMRIWTTDLNPAFEEVGRRILAPLAVDHWELADLHEFEPDTPEPQFEPT